MSTAITQSFVPTAEQEAIVESVADRSGPSVMVEAGAGCAKSSTLELAAPGIRDAALALAFNKSIATELQRRVPGNFKVSTFNGLGHGALIRGPLRGKTIKLEARKLGTLVSQIAKDQKVQLLSDQWDQVRQLVQRAMRENVIPGATDPETWPDLCDDCWIPREDQPLMIDLATQVLRRNNELMMQGVISFDDQIYGSLNFGGVFTSYPVVFVDEAQDLSPQNHQMITRVAGRRLVVVGDRHQAIYGFRGADHTSMDSLKELRQQWTELPLMTTFRCPRAIVARQQDHVPGFRAAPSAPEGEIISLRPPKWITETAPWDGWKWADVEALAVSAGSSGSTSGTIAVLCRNNAPLLALAFKLLRGNTPVKFLGREIGKQLGALVTKIAKDEATPIARVIGLIREWMEGEASLALANGHEERVAGIYDRGDSLLAIAEGAHPADAGGLRRAVEALFARDSGRVTLSSIHQAKGLEWDTVVHLDPWRIPSPHAKRAAASGDGAPLVQEKNLRYVAETRTKRALVLASLEDMME